MQNCGKPIEASDAKGAKTLSAFDTLQRLTHVWAQNNSSDTLRLTIYSLYGEAAVNPKMLNLLGQAWQVYDESGKTESVAFDFKGNLLSKKQQVISSAELKAALDNYQTYLVDWTGLPTILSTQIFETSSEYDALNRVTRITLPENVNNERKEIVPTYNRAGALEQVRYDGAVYVENIAYNAKGQRLLIAFGNDIMTRYVYQPTTFRLIRQRSEKFTKTHTGNTITYTAVSGTSRQDDGFNFDLVGNILKILTRVTDCGITGGSLGSDALDKVFSYNSVYRLTSATGRESNTQHENDYLYADAPVPGSPNANHVQAYKREYDYDKLGNVLQVKQLGNNAFTRNFNYHTGKNTLEKVETGSASLIENFTYDACGNQLTAGASRDYVWNAANQLITYYNQAGSADPTIFAQYDYAGQERVSKIVRTGTNANPVYERTIYIDGIFEYHILENGTTYEKNYVHIMDDRSRIAMVRVGDQFPDDINEAITYNLENQIGSSTVRLTETGTIIDKEEYYPFGDSSLRTFSKKRYRYVGREKDLESGLYYYGARYYCAWTCRFISVDPLASKYAQLTPYNYADNNPVNDYDIDGMQNNNTSNSEKGGVSSGSLPFPKPQEIKIQSPIVITNINPPDGSYKTIILPDFKVEGKKDFNYYGSLFAQGFVGGLKHSLKSIKQQFTKEGLLSNALFALNPGVVVGNGLSDLTKEVANNWSGYKTEDFVYAAGFTAEKVVEFALLRKVSKLASLKKPVNTPGKAPVSESKIISNEVAVATKDIATKEIDGLIKAGNALDKGGFTAVGRALQKHGSRKGSIFPKATGNTASINAQGEAVLKGILTNPNVTSVARYHARFGNVLEYRILGGQGARFSGDGKTFIGFLE